MVELIRYTFESFWHFCQVCIMSFVITAMFSLIMDSFKIKIVHVHKEDDE